MADARQFNIRDDQGKLLCPACGFPEYVVTDAYDEAGGISLGICPCCLWEPGFDDNPAASGHAKPSILGSLQAYRAKWSADPSWAVPGNPQPASWDALSQLAHLFEAAPHVR